jgi:hypothetical protein
VIGKIYLIILMLIIPFVIYQMFFSKAGKGTPYSVAEQFLDAAKKQDNGRIEALCVAEAQSDALLAAKQIGEAQPAVYSFSVFERGPQWKKAAGAGVGEKALFTMISGRHLVLYMKKHTAGWKIVRVDYSP